MKQISTIIGLFLLPLICLSQSPNINDGDRGHYNVMTYVSYDESFGENGIKIHTKIPTDYSHNVTVYIKGFDFTRKNIGCQLSWSYDKDHNVFDLMAASCTGSHFNINNSNNYYLSEEEGVICLSLDEEFKFLNLEITAFCDGAVCDAGWFTNWTINEEVNKSMEFYTINRFGIIDAFGISSKTYLNGHNSTITNTLNVGSLATVGGLNSIGNATVGGTLGVTAATTLNNTVTLSSDPLKNGIADNKILSTNSTGQLQLINHNAYWLKHGTSGSNPNTIGYNGTVYIGANPTTPTITESKYKLVVAGTIGTEKVKVTQLGWADYVFAKDYKLQPLTEIEKFIKANQHLPEIPSEKEVKENGVDIGETQVLLLKKIEELTLHLIEQQKEIKKQREGLKEQKNLIDKLSRRINKK